jgi:ABC-type Na+ efflux pump permease subunit
VSRRFNVNPRKILRIARWEVSKSVGTVSRRTLVLAVVGVAIAGLAGPSLASGGVDLDDGIYRVAVDDENPLHDVANETEQFAVVGPDGDWDVRIAGNRITRSDTRKGNAAYSAFRRSILEYNDDLMREERDSGGDAASASGIVERFE